MYFRLFIIYVLSWGFSLGLIAQVAINTNGASPDASAMLDVSSTSQGVLFPRITTSERVAISSPDTGLMVFDTDFKSFWLFNGMAWTNLSQGQRSSVHSLVKGEIYNGGVLFHLYFDSNGVEHGLLMNTNFYQDIIWSNNTSSITGCYSSWDGATNTDTIHYYNLNVATGSSYPYKDSVLAAGAYIPSVGELHELFNNRYLINRGLNKAGSPELVFSDDYWSSSQEDASNEVAVFRGYRMFWYQRPKNNTSTIGLGIKSF